LLQLGGSLERRLLLLVAAVALPLLGVAAFAVRDAFSTERARAEERLQTRARAMAVLVDREIGRVEALLRTAARSEFLRSGDVKGFLTEAEAVAAELGGAWVGVTDRNGTRLLNTFWPEGAPPPGSRGSETASLALSAGRTAVSNLIQDTRAGERTPVIVVAAPVTRSGPGGAPAYAVTATVRVDTLGAVLGELELPEGWVGAVLDGSGTIVGRTVRPGDTVGLEARPSVLGALASGQPTGIVHGVRTLEDTLSFVAYARIPRTGYAALVAVPEEVFTAPLRAALARTVAIGGVLALAGLLLALATARQLAHSLSRLVDGPPGTGLANIREIDAVARRLAASDAERGRAERELRVARDEAVEILESIGDGFYALDADRRVAYVNSRALATFDKRREELIGRRFDEVFPAADGSRVTPILHEVTRCAEPREFEVDACLQGRWTAFSAYPRRGGGVSVYFRDVSPRRAAEAALRESEEQFRATFEQAAVGIAHVGLDGRWLRANRRLCGITGYSRDELLRLGFQDITHPDDLDADLDQVRALLAGEIGSYRMEKRYLRPDRTPVWTLLTVSLLRPSAADAQPYFVSVVEDISELKRAEAARRESERRYRFLAENNPQIVWTARPDGLLDYFNHRWTEVTGLPVEAGIGEGWATTIHPDDLPRMNAAWGRSLATGEPYAIEHRVRTRDGVWRWFRSQGAALRAADGGIQLWVGTAADVHDEREALEEVRRLNADLEHRVVERTAQLADANAELESFAYSVAHDLRAPLRGMQGFSRALLEDHADALGETGRDYAGRIARGAERLDDLINDLLAYSRLAREEIRSEPVELEGLVADVLRHMDPQIEQARAALQLERPFPAVIGQRAVLTQVLMNLIGNAIKFVPPGAEPRVRVWAEHRGGNARIWVEDNGIGICPEHRDKIFRVFERLHGQKAYPGTGIGLAIVKKGIERLGGSVGVVSEPGRGSRFWFELPKERSGHGDT
jgi:PAS domain S-box-containing protein